MRWFLVLVGAGTALVGTLGVLRQRLLIATVDGGSMEPTLYAGDRLLVLRRHPRKLRRGDVVILDPPRVRIPTGSTWCEPLEGNQVKRVAALPGEPTPPGIQSSSPVVPPGTVVVLSDNTEVGLDSRRLGFYSAGGVVGVVVRRLTAQPRLR